MHNKCIKINVIDKNEQTFALYCWGEFLSVSEIFQKSIKINFLKIYKIKVGRKNLRLKNHFIKPSFDIPPLGYDEEYIFIFYENLNYTYEANYIIVKEKILNKLLLELLFMSGTICRKEENNVYCRKFLYKGQRNLHDYIIIAESYNKAEKMVRKYIDDKPIIYYRR